MQLSLKGTETVNNLQLLDFWNFRFLLSIPSHGLIDYGNQKNVQFFFGSRKRGNRCTWSIITSGWRARYRIQKKAEKPLSSCLFGNSKPWPDRLWQQKMLKKSTIFCSRKRVKRCTWSIIKGTTSMQAPITNKILNLALVLCCSSSSSSLYSALCFFLAFKP